MCTSKSKDQAGRILTDAELVLIEQDNMLAITLDEASALATIEQSFGGELFYPNVASRAAHLLYFIIIINDNTLVTVALLVAQSDPSHKD